MEKFTAVFEQDGEWWIGYLEELPGATAEKQNLLIKILNKHLNQQDYLYNQHG